MIDKGHILLGDSTMGGLPFICVFRVFLIIFSVVLSKLRPLGYPSVSIMQNECQERCFYPIH